MSHGSHVRRTGPDPPARPRKRGAGNQEEATIPDDQKFPDNRLPNDDDASSSEERCRRRWACLKPYMPEGSVGAELGVFKGNFVDYLLATKPRKLYLVDPWFRGYKEWHWAKGERSPIAAFAKLLAAFRPEIEAGVLEPRVEFSTNFLADAPDRHFDWVYIDTNHSYETTVEELTLAVAKVKPTGFIMGDDYYPDPAHKLHGVHAAVKEFEAADRLKVVVDGTEDQFVARVV